MADYFKYGKNKKEINYEQFQKLLRNSSDKVDANTWKQFSMFDYDRSGKIDTEKEIKSLFEALKNAAEINQDNVLDDVAITSALGLESQDGVNLVEEILNQDLPEITNDSVITREEKDRNGNTIIYMLNEDGAWNTTVLYPNGSIKARYVVYKQGEEPPAQESYSQENIANVYNVLPELVVGKDGTEGKNTKYIAQAQYSPYAQIEIALNSGSTFYSIVRNTLNQIEDFKTREDFFTYLGEQLIAFDPAGDHLSVAEIKEELEKLLSEDGKAMQLYKETQDLAKMPTLDWLEVFKHRFKEITGKEFNFYNNNKFQIVENTYSTYKTYEYQENLYTNAANEIRSLKGSLEDDKYTSDELQEYIKEGILPDDAYKNTRLRKTPRAIALHYLIKTMGSKEAAEILLTEMGFGETYGNESQDVQAYSELLTNVAAGFKQKKTNALRGETPESLEAKYTQGLKDIYGYTDREAEVMKLMEYSQAAGGTVELALDMVLMAVGGEAVMAVNSGKFANSLNKVGQVLTKIYGPQRSAEAMKFLSTINNVGIDTAVHAASLAFSGDTLENKANNLLERAKTSSDYMFFGSYVMSPAFEKLTQFLTKTGAAERGFWGVVENKALANGIKSKSVNATKFMSNVMQGNEGGFIEGLGRVMFDIAGYSAHDAIVHQEDLESALKGQLEFQAGMGMFSHFMHMAVSSRITEAVKINQMRNAIKSERLQNIEVREETNSQGQKKFYCVDTKENKILYETENPNAITGYLMAEVSRAIAIEQAKQQMIDEEKAIKELQNSPKEPTLKPTFEESDEPDVLEGNNSALNELQNKSQAVQDNIIGDSSFKNLPDVKGKTILSTPLEQSVERRVRIQNLHSVEKVESPLGKRIDKKIFDLNISDPKLVNDIRKDLKILSMSNPEEAENLTTLLNALTGNKKCIEVTREEVAAVTQHLIRQYQLEEETIAGKVEELAGGTLGAFSGRVKSSMSMFDKIANYAKEHPDDSFMKAVQEPRDTEGNRFTLEVVKTDPERIQELVTKYGKDEAARIIMKENSQYVVDFMQKIIDEKGEFFDITRVSNYRDMMDLSILDEAQIYALQEKAAENGFVVVRGGKKIFQQKQQGSGYPALQINLKTVTGKTIEVQIRFEPVHDYAESEHFVYDVMTNKDIIGKYTKLEPLLNPFIKALKDNMTQEEYDNYYINYTRAQYRHRFLKGLGIETPEPELQDFAPPGKPFDERLRAENLFKLHEIVEDVKKGRIDSQKAVEKYNTALKGLD